MASCPGQGVGRTGGILTGTQWQLWLFHHKCQVHKEHSKSLCQIQHAETISGALWDKFYSLWEVCGDPNLIILLGFFLKSVTVLNLALVFDSLSLFSNEVLEDEALLAWDEGPPNEKYRAMAANLISSHAFTCRWKDFWKERIYSRWINYFSF